jgi:Na+-driven multidrug efflux pump
MSPPDMDSARSLSGLFFCATAHWHRWVLALALPIIAANLTQPILGAVDTAVAGHLPDPAYLGGVAAGSLFFSFVFWGIAGIGAATATADAAGSVLGAIVLWRMRPRNLLEFQTIMAYALDGFAHAAEALVGAAIGARP